jgi:hypothetical protein
VLSTVFTGTGGYQSADAFVSGLTPALWVGVGVLALGALTAAALPFSTRAQQQDQAARAQSDQMPIVLAPGNPDTAAVAA